MRLVASLMRDTPAMPRELKVAEQKYRALLVVLDGIPVMEIAERFGVARQTAHRWMVRYGPVLRRRRQNQYRSVHRTRQAMSTS